MMRGLAAVAVLLPSAHAQIMGATCKQYPASVPGGSATPKLCVPKMCAAPKAFWPLNSGLPGEPSDPWNFTLPNGGTIMFTEPNLYGYNMHDICGAGINAYTPVTFAPGMAPPGPGTALPFNI